MISIEKIIYQKENKQEDIKIFEKINNKLSVLLTNHKRSQYIEQIWNAGGITLRHFHCASSACSRLNAFITNSFEVFSFDLIGIKNPSPIHIMVCVSPFMCSFIYSLNAKFH